VKKERGGLPIWEREKRTLTSGLVASVRNLEISNLEITAIVIHAIFTSTGGPGHRGDCAVNAVFNVVNVGVEIMSYHVPSVPGIDEGRNSNNPMFFSFLIETADLAINF
jgi:hypothetical protein